MVNFGDALNMKSTQYDKRLYNTVRAVVCCVLRVVLPLSLVHSYPENEARSCWFFLWRVTIYVQILSSVVAAKNTTPRESRPRQNCKMDINK